MDDDELLTTAQVAEFWGVTVDYVNRLARLRRITYVRKTKGRTGTYLFRPADVERRKGPPSG